MRVVVAPDKFKGSLTAVEVARAICEGLSAARPDIEVVAVPVADGGDGTLDAVADAGFTRVPIQATGPTGLPVTTGFAVRAGTVVVELADVVGLARLPQGVPAPLAASTYGLGEVVRAVFKHAADRLVVGVGGSASTDGGAGLVQALGARLVDSSGDIVRAGGSALLDLARIDTSDLCPLPAGLDVLVACDVDNPLVGPSGAARVFARQKGASPDEVDLLERAMQRWADVTRAARGLDVASHPGAGAAGGVAF